MSNYLEYRGKCKSEALDFGKEVVIDDITGLEVENSYDE